MSSAPSQVMQCMEVWGGNRPMNSGVEIGGLDAWVYSQPYKGDERGGDVYYVSSCATGRITRLLVADVSGHGEGVSATAISLRGLMRKYVNFLDQTQLVQSLNTQFARLSEEGRFATAITMTFFGPTRHLTLCNAGHPPPMLYRSREKRWDVLQPGEAEANYPWGIVDQCDYDQLQLPLDVDDLLLCYTDALPEARTDGGEFLGTENLLRIVATLDASAPAALISSLLEAINREGYKTADDVTALLLRPSGIAPQRNLLEPFRIIGRMARGFARSIRSGESFPRPDLKVANWGGAFIPRLNQWWGGKSKA
jgi:sigma-B regulation protein RsbU (phosphoserine phosphatase)